MRNDDDILNENNDETDVRNDVLLLHRGQLVRNRIINDFFI